jgi:hypothetical protein
MSVIWTLKRRTERLRQKRGLPPIEDPNDIPDPKEAKDYVSVSRCRCRCQCHCHWTHSRQDTRQAVLDEMIGTTLTPGTFGQGSGEPQVSTGDVRKVPSESRLSSTPRPASWITGISDIAPYPYYLPSILYEDMTSSAWPACASNHSVKPRAARLRWSGAKPERSLTHLDLVQTPCDRDAQSFPYGVGAVEHYRESWRTDYRYCYRYRYSHMPPEPLTFSDSSICCAVLCCAVLCCAVLASAS